jgi:uncharacterized protein
VLIPRAADKSRRKCCRRRSTLRTNTFLTRYVYIQFLRGFCLGFGEKMFQSQPAQGLSSGAAPAQTPIRPQPDATHVLGARHAVQPQPAPSPSALMRSQPAPAPQRAPQQTQIQRPSAPPQQPANQPQPLVQKPANTERRGRQQPTERMIGHVTFCSGARATVSTAATNMSGATADFWAVGRLISIEVGESRVVALVYEMRTDRAAWDEEQANSVSVHVELVGEVSDDDNGRVSFKRGVSRYPQVGAIAHKIRVSDLEIMHDLGEKTSVEIGRLTQNEDVPATISVEDMLRKHFAVVGTTGVGKSCSVTLLVRQCLSVKPELRVLILDPHNEFSSAFGNEASLLDANTLEMPFWLFKFDEMEDVVFRSKIVEEEADILRELISLGKAQFHAEKIGQTVPGTLRKSVDPGNFNADTPTPYRFSDVFKLIDEMLGQLEPRFDRIRLKSLRVRLDSLFNDQRYSFMFPKGGVGDNFGVILGMIFRLPAMGKPISIINLSGLPSDVTNAVVSVLARLSFDVAFASEGSVHVLLVCEEAHRYVPQDVNAGFLPTRRAIARIAKEGRKYGCSIAVVSQRPGELDPTILSQCSTVFAMRLSNDRDQFIIKSAISDSGASTISFLSALDNREAIVFGEGVATPMRFKFTFQESAKLPSAPGTSVQVGAQSRVPIPDAELLVARLRGPRIEAVLPDTWVPASAPQLRKSAPLAHETQASSNVTHTTAAGTPIRPSVAPITGLRPGGW